MPLASCVCWSGGTEGIGKGFLYSTSCLCCPFNSVLGEPGSSLCQGPRCSWGKILGSLLWNSDPGQGCQIEWGGRRFRKLGKECLPDSQTVAWSDRWGSGCGLSGVRLEHLDPQQTPLSCTVSEGKAGATNG